MDPGFDVPSSRIQHMGLDQLFWCLLGLLCHCVGPPSFRYILGRVCANSPALSRRDLFRASNGRWLL